MVLRFKIKSEWDSLIILCGCGEEVITMLFQGIVCGALPHFRTNLIINELHINSNRTYMVLIGQLFCCEIERQALRLLNKTKVK